LQWCIKLFTYFPNTTEPNQNNQEQFWVYFLIQPIKPRWANVAYHV
jgi:hypothetical protein